MHTKLRISLLYSKYCHNIMPVSWKNSACYLYLALNPDSALDVAEIKDSGWFFTSRFNSMSQIRGRRWEDTNMIQLNPREVCYQGREFPDWKMKCLKSQFIALHSDLSA